MFTLDMYRTAINPKASDLRCVQVGKIYGTITGCIAIVVSIIGILLAIGIYILFSPIGIAA